MNIRIRRLSPAPLSAVEAERQRLMSDVLVGLSSTPKWLAARYHYDAEGSALFDAICDAADYYLTGCEFEILRRHGSAVAARFAGRALDVVDLGAGDGRKTAVLIEALRAAGVAVRYVPLDISAAAMATVTEAMAARFPGLPIEGLVGDWFDGIRWLAAESDRPRLVLFLGSNIGNFDRPHAGEFLHRLADALRPGDHVLAGFDLKKEIEVIRLAYNDGEGAARRFNLNLLERLNRDLGADFDRARFSHYAMYEPVKGAIEFYLVSRVAQRVRVEALRRSFDFGAWEALRVGASQKFLPGEVDAMAQAAGFVVEGAFFDERGWFCDALWSVGG